VSEEVLKIMKRYVLIITGRALDFLANDRSSLDNLAFLCAVSGRVIGC